MHFKGFQHLMTFVPWLFQSSQIVFHAQSIIYLFMLLKMEKIIISKIYLVYVWKAPYLE
jgi:hypothetical protein